MGRIHSGVTDQCLGELLWLSLCSCAPHGFAALAALGAAAEFRTFGGGPRRGRHFGKPFLLLAQLHIFLAEGERPLWLLVYYL